MGSAGHMQPHEVCAAVHFLLYRISFKSVPHFRDSWRTAAGCISYFGFAGYKVHKVKRAVH